MPKRDDLDQRTSINDSVKHDRTEKGMRSPNVGAVPVDGHPGVPNVGSAQKEPQTPPFQGPPTQFPYPKYNPQG